MSIYRKLKNAGATLMLLLYGIVTLGIGLLVLSLGYVIKYVFFDLGEILMYLSYVPLSMASIFLELWIYALVLKFLIKMYYSIRMDKT